jgi:hypothetical protein
MACPGLRSGACTVREGAAAVMRLLDRALRAHGRDAGYEIQAWRDHALVDAAAQAAVVAMMEPEDRPQSYLVETTGEAFADVIIALHRDRVGVPEALAQALSTMRALQR